MAAERPEGQPGKLVDYSIGDVQPEMSLLEMLDLLNEDLIVRGEEPVAFDSDCREGICGACGLVIDGVPHGPKNQVTTCEYGCERSIRRRYW